MDRIVIHGKIDIKPAIVAPIPSVTSKAGKAQQIKVLRLVNKLKKELKVACKDYFPRFVL